MAGAADELGHGGVNSRAKIGVLVGPGALELEVLVLGLEGGELVLHQKVHQRTVVAVCVVDDVSGGGLDQIAQVAGVGLILVGNAINRPLGLASAVADLMPDLVESALHVVAQIADALGDVVADGVYGRIHARKALTQRVLYAGKAVERVGVLSIEAVAQAVLNAVELVVDALGIKAALDLAKYAAAVASAKAAAEAAAEAAKAVAAAEAASTMIASQSPPQPPRPPKPPP